MAWDFGMPPPGFDQLIAQKYALETTRTNAMANQANADANLTNIKAGLLPGETAANIGLTKANTSGQLINNQYLPQTLMARVGLEGAQANEAQANASQTGLQTNILGRAARAPLSSLFGGSQPPALSAPSSFGGGF
jgi:hypothetical protein